MSLQLNHTSSEFRIVSLETFDESPALLRILLFMFSTLLYSCSLFFVHIELLSYLTESLLDGFALYGVYAGVLSFVLIYHLPSLSLRFRPFRKSILGMVQFLAITAALAVFYVLRFKSDSIFSSVPPLSEIGILLFALGLFASLYYLAMWAISIMVEEIQRRDTDLQLAQKIQSQLVPTVHSIDEFSHTFGTTHTAYEVGGDFFESNTLEDGRHICAVGDVTGHDIAAGLLMAIAKGAFHTLLQQRTSLGDVATSLNRTIVENSDKKMFLSFSFCRFNYATSEVELVNAGHLPLLHYSAKSGEVNAINPNGMAFGLMKSATFETTTVSFERGDVFLFLTDGLIEMTDNHSEEYGLDRVSHFLKKNASFFSPKELYTELLLDVNRYTGFKKIDDDVTFLATKIH